MIQDRNRTFSFFRLRVFPRESRRLAALCLSGLALHFAPPAGLAEAPPPPKNTEPPPILAPPTSRNQRSNGTEGMTVLPSGAYQAEPVGIRHATLFRNTRFPSGNPVSLPNLEPSARTETVTTRLRVNLPTVSAGLPFLQRGFEPQEADLKVGPFYFKLRALQGAILHSDNIDLEPDDERESGTIAITSLTLSAVAQLTESLRIATTGSLVYLPLEHKGGVAGFGVTDLYSFGLLAGPALRTQIAWETQIGGWTVVFADDFQILLGTYSNNLRSDYVLFEGGGFDEESRAGRYSYRPQGTRYSNDGDREDIERDFEEDFVVFSNTASVSTERLLPGPVRLRARIYREDLWYNQGNRGLPRLREGAYASLASERPNMRFKPFISYEAFRTDRDDNFQHTIRAGIDGPITDQLRLHADFGYYFGNEQGEGYVWRVSLDHTVGPYTHQALYYGRNFSFFHDELIEGVGYNLQQILGPDLSASLYASYSKIESFADDEDEDDFTRREQRAGLRFTYVLGPKTTIGLSGTYVHSDPDNTETFTTRLEIGYNFTDTLLARLLYQRQDTSSDIRDLNYTENLIFLSVSKYFD